MSGTNARRDSPLPRHGGHSLLLGKMTNANGADEPVANSPEQSDVDDGLAQVSDQLHDAVLHEKEKEEPVEQVRTGE